jgi:hypothetical protein
MLRKLCRMHRRGLLSQEVHAIAGKCVERRTEWLHYSASAKRPMRIQRIIRPPR